MDFLTSNRRTKNLQHRSQKLLQISERNNFPIKYMGEIEPYRGYKFFPGQHRDWVMLPMVDDPLYEKGFPIPASTKIMLGAILQAGIEFNDIYVAHEIEHGSLRKYGIEKAVQVQLPKKQQIQVDNINYQIERFAGKFIEKKPELKVVHLGVVPEPPPMPYDPVLMGALVNGKMLDIFYLTHWIYQ